MIYFRHCTENHKLNTIFTQYGIEKRILKLPEKSPSIHRQKQTKKNHIKETFFEQPRGLYE